MAWNDGSLDACDIVDIDQVKDTSFISKPWCIMKV